MLPAVLPPSGRYSAAHKPDRVQHGAWIPGGGPAEPGLQYFCVQLQTSSALFVSFRGYPISTLPHLHLPCPSLAQDPHSFAVSLHLHV